MIFCIDNAEKSEDIVKCIVDSLSISDTPLSKKVTHTHHKTLILNNQ
jgi:hypothetical protein